MMIINIISRKPFLFLSSHKRRIVHPPVSVETALKIQTHIIPDATHNSALSVAALSEHSRVEISDPGQVAVGGSKMSLSAKEAGY